jgi:hypothetical protein
MKHDSTFQNGIHANLKAMHQILETATKETSDACGHMSSNEQNMAIGTVILVEEYLEKATSLFKAAIALHRCKL